MSVAGVGAKTSCTPWVKPGRSKLSLPSTLLTSVAPIAVAVACATIATDVVAQPMRFDANGVDVVAGTVSPIVTEVSIGQPGAGGLSYSRMVHNISNVDGLLEPSLAGGPVTVVIGYNPSETFTVSGSAFVSANGSGDTLTYNSASDTYTYTAADGTVYTFTAPGGTSYVYTLTGVKHPMGEVDTYTFTTGTGMYGPEARLASVTNNYGYQLKFEYESDTPTDANWGTRAKITGINNAVDYCSPSADHCSSFSTTWPSVNYTEIGSNEEQASDALGRVTSYYFTSLPNGQLNKIVLPSGLTKTFQFNSAYQVSSYSNGVGTWQYAYSTVGTTQTTTVTGPVNGSGGNDITTYTIDTTIDAITAIADHPSAPTSRTTTYGYDTSGRLTQITYPLGDAVQYGYDARGNVTAQTHVPVPGSGLGNVVTSANFDAVCSNIVKCNQPNSTTDANGNVTNYTYDPTYGFVTKIDLPTPTGSNQPESRFSYTSLYAYYKNSAGSIVRAATPVMELTGISTCQTGAPGACAGTSDELKTTIVRGSTGVANNLLPTLVTQASGNGSLAKTTSLSYDAASDLASSVGPLGAAQTTVFVYDADRERIGVFGPEASVTTDYPTTKMSYTPDGLVSEVDQGSDPSQSDSSFATFTSLQQQITVYDSIDRVVKEEVAAGGTTYNVKQVTFDNANRLVCTAVRMNPAAFGSLPSSACTLATPGANGNDRITQNTYDNADELTKIVLALGDPTQSTYATYSYTPNGRIATTADANNNLTANTYDALDRLVKIAYPVATKGAGVSDSADYEAYTYDGNQNPLTVRRRSGDTVTYTYDALNRVTEKAVPSWSGQNVYYSYDLLSRLTSTNYGSPTGVGVSYTYDALSRKTTERAGSLTLSSQYDLAGDLTRITWPDNFFVNYVYDVLQRPTKLEENGATSGIGVLATYTYDNLGQLTAIARGNGANTSLGYDGAGRLSSLAHTFINTTANVSWTFTYDAANDILTRSATNDAYTSHPAALNLSYVANGLNEYSSVSGTTYGYDARGNLTSDGARTFTYDVDNKLLTGSAPTSTSFAYDPLGRMQTDTASATTTTFLYDGFNLSAEYNNAGALLRRYVPSGLAVDTPLVWYEGSSTADRRWLHTDDERSIVAYSDASGDQDAAYGYSPYGEPSSWSGPRYAYTGQLAIPENNLYNFKAREYDAKLGRFLQVDPAFADNNLYRYVGDSPTNLSDPTGLLGPANTPCQNGEICVYAQPGPNPTVAVLHGIAATLHIAAGIPNVVFNNIRISIENLVKKDVCAAAGNGRSAQGTGTYLKGELNDVPGYNPFLGQIGYDIKVWSNGNGTVSYAGEWYGEGDAWGLNLGASMDIGVLVPQFRNGEAAGYGKFLGDVAHDVAGAFKPAIGPDAGEGQAGAGVGFGGGWSESDDKGAQPTFSGTVKC